jgi:peptide/nickel transport system permease protein
LFGYISRRLVQAVFVLILVTIIVFLLMRLLPGDPLLLYIVRNELNDLTPAQIEHLRADLGLDKSLPVQYFNWLGGILHGDFGNALFRPEKVGTLLVERLPISLYLGILALLLSSIVGVLAGLISALRRGSWLDTLVTSIANFGISVPVFWLGVLMVYLFSLSLKWLPVQGFTSPFTDFWLSTRQLIMPVICEATVALAANTRQSRSSILEVVQQDYIRTAWSKGLRERAVVLKHVLKNGLIPVITLIGIQVSHIIGGSVLVETVFNIPGMGRLMVEAVFNQDFPIVQGGVLVIATMVTLANLAVDISYGLLDPRIRYG